MQMANAEGNPQLRTADSAPPIRRGRLALLLWTAAWPTVTVVLSALGPVLKGLPIYVQTLIISAILVPVMTFLVTPAIHRWFGSWIRARE